MREQPMTQESKFQNNTKKFDEKILTIPKVSIPV